MNLSPNKQYDTEVTKVSSSMIYCSVLGLSIRLVGV